MAIDALGPIGQDLDPDLRRVTFEPVPEVDAKRLDEFLDNLMNFCLTTSDRSFGAYVIKAGGESAVERVKQTQRELASRWKARVKPQTFHNDEFESGIHTDRYPIVASINKPSVWLAEEGLVRAVFLVGAAEDIDKTSTLEPAGKRVSLRHLIERGKLPNYITTPPQAALVVDLSPNDVVVFDDTQPHGFKSLTETRQSTAHYLVPVI